MFVLLQSLFKVVKTSSALSGVACTNAAGPGDLLGFTRTFTCYWRVLLVFLSTIYTISVVSCSAVGLWPTNRNV
jgi:hypothetical protein